MQGRIRFAPPTLDDYYSFLEVHFSSLATKASSMHAGFDKLSQHPLAELVEANAFAKKLR